MDIEEYLRKKRELEAKKEMLESKEKIEQDKERLKRERERIYAEHGVEPKVASSHHQPSHEEGSHHYRSPSVGPGIWNTLLLFLIVVLLVVSYFIPRFGEQEIRKIIKEETGEEGVAEQKGLEEEQEEVGKKKVQEEEEQEEEEEEETYIGPKFSLSVKDDTQGLFDDDGKIDGEILVINVLKGPKYYQDFTLSVENKESDRIMCKLDREVQIDTNFDGKIDLKDVDLDRYKIEIKPKLVELINYDVVPGSIDMGNYEGKGDIATTYDVRCYFCLDDECNQVEERGETEQEIFFRVFINRELDGLNTTNKTR